ncbi:hypothetical protein ACJVC5_08200 [Peredibacter sp. HCB2-198]|uniref:hypothetical protein n=1 Tax=Peredibacter sp. HCB2-198 TaxID=3383025 RepID=UPI0038B51D27
MEKELKPLAILNLTGALTPELAHYFQSRNIRVFDPLETSEEADWTHIITKDIHDFSLIGTTYDVVEKDRHIISLSKVNDIQNFTINYGNLVLDDVWFQGQMGPFILDKYFQGYGGITLGDNYPSFQELGSFQVANPFNTGEYLDRMVQKAFESGIEALTVKTYFDHLVMYLAGLKKKGKVGLPFEVTYGAYEDVFAVQMHFFSEPIDLLDVSTSLSQNITKKAEEYFLNISVQSADFFDFSYMADVNKVIVTALWTKDERIKFENRGLMFSALVPGRMITQYQMEGQTSILVQGNSTIPDLTEKVIIPDNLPPEVIEKSVVKGLADAKEEKTVVSGLPGEAEAAQLVKGTVDPLDTSVEIFTEDETRDEPSLVKGLSELEQLINTVKGKFEEEKDDVRIAGDKLDVDKTAWRIAATVDESTKENNLKVRILGDKLPEHIKTGLFDFAKGIDKQVEDLDNHDLDRFQLERLPDIIKAGLLQQRALSNEKQAVLGISPQAMKVVETKLMASQAENEKLRTQIKHMASEVRILKDTRNKMAEVQMKAAQAAALEASTMQMSDEDDELRKQFQQKLAEQKELNDQELKKLSGLLERETKLIADVKMEEMKAKKLQIEALQKETFFGAEIEKAQKQIKAKDTIIMKTKESFLKLVEKKDKELLDLRSKNDQMTKALATGPSQNQSIMIKELERQNQNLAKQLDVYKVKVSSLATNMSSTKDDGHSKEEVRKLHMVNNQLKNQAEAAKKELLKVQEKMIQDTSQIASLKQDKTRLEGLLKKAAMETVKEPTPSVVPGPQPDQELKRLQAQTQIMETQNKEAQKKIAELEAKLVEALKPQKNNGGVDEASKVKIAQMEASVKKLTMDLVETKNQLADMKKETNKLRQEKTALQNQADKMKKEAEKAKTAAPPKKKAS